MLDQDGTETRVAIPGRIMLDEGVEKTLAIIHTYGGSAYVATHNVPHQCAVS